MNFPTRGPGYDSRHFGAAERDPQLEPVTWRHWTRGALLALAFLAAFYVYVAACGIGGGR